MINYDLTNLHVLIVEKHAPMRAMLREVLRQFGIEKIDHATTPEAGFEVFNEMKPDLVLADWAPDFDGVELLRRVRTDPASAKPDAAVIMVTAYNETSHVYEALDAGMTEYLAKPVSAKLLYTRIVSGIENKRRFIRAPEFTGPDRRRRPRSDFGGADRRDSAA